MLRKALLLAFEGLAFGVFLIGLASIVMVIG